MIERALAGYVKGAAHIGYHPDGLAFSLEASVSALTAE